MLEDKQKEKMKNNRILLYESKIFELEMDKVAAAAVADDSAITDIDLKLSQLRTACEAIKNM